ncbi:hypothetical protein J6590_100970 [Homalodisca vitripennis]|nr:hypothetical protein J6590_100970 [Homalodisca vitripennis]
MKSLLILTGVVGEETYWSSWLNLGGTSTNKFVLSQAHRIGTTALLPGYTRLSQLEVLLTPCGVEHIHCCRPLLNNVRDLAY